MKVLLADDNHDVVEDVKYVLRQVFGGELELVVVHTGEQLQEQLQQGGYDFVFTDDNFGAGIRGSEVIKTATGTGYAGPVVIFTGDDSVVGTRNNVVVVDKMAGDDEIIAAIKAAMNG